MNHHSRYIDIFFGAYEQKAKAAVISPGVGQVLFVHSVNVQNRAGAAQNMGVMVKLANAGFLFGQLVALAVPQLTDVTAAIQGGAATNIFTTNNNDGFLVQSPNKFGLIGLTISQAQTVAPVYAYEYWNGAAWVALPDVLDTPNYVALADTYLTFTPPRDWVAGTDAGTGGTSTNYAIRARATTAGGQAVKATAVWVAKFIHFQEAIPTSGNLSVVSTMDNSYPIMLNALEGLLPYFQTANAKNLVTIQFQSAN